MMANKSAGVAMLSVSYQRYSIYSAIIIPVGRSGVLASARGVVENDRAA
jgi:hypothetical protein